jgi:hypothetical protein
MVKSIILSLFLCLNAYADCNQYATESEIVSYIQAGDFTKNLATAASTCVSAPCRCIDGKDLRDFDIVNGAPVHNSARHQARRDAAAAELQAELSAKQAERDDLVAKKLAIKNASTATEKIQALLQFIKAKEKIE